MHITTTRRRGRAARGLLAVALVTAATAGGALGVSDARAAQAVPDWIADFTAASDAFEGMGGGGGRFTSRQVGCGWYYAYVDGVYRKVLWCDYTTPPGVPGPRRECRIEDESTHTSRLIRCPE